MSKKGKKFKKDEGIWTYERRENSLTEIPKILLKTWDEVTRADLTYLLSEDWTSIRIQAHFEVSLNKFLFKIRFSDSYNKISNISI